MSSASWAGPLQGIRVLDFTRVLAGPSASLALADLGAEVLKLEPPGTGDETRLFPPFRDDVSHYFLSVNRGKKSIVVDLKTAAGVLRTVPWDGVRLAGMVEAHVKIQGLTEKVAPLRATHDSLWVAYAEGGLAQVMLEKENPKRAAIFEMFAAQLGDRWKGDQLSNEEVIRSMMPSAVRGSVPPG